MSQFAKAVAVDGPSASGKSTAARGLARELGLLYVNTGAMYRAVALAFHEAGVLLEDSQRVQRILADLQLDYQQVATGEERILLQGRDRTSDLRQHFISRFSSRVSQLLPVRSAMVEMQRELAQGQVCVMEGRDIGTVVFPDAFVKFFLSANGKIRAERRLAELRERGEGAMSYEQVYQDMMRRDQADSERELAPLVKAEDAIELDSTQLGAEEVLEEMKRHVLIWVKRRGVQL